MGGSVNQERYEKLSRFDEEFASSLISRKFPNN